MEQHGTVEQLPCGTGNALFSLTEDEGRRTGGFIGLIYLAFPSDVLALVILDDVIPSRKLCIGSACWSDLILRGWSGETFLIRQKLFGIQFRPISCTACNQFLFSDQFLNEFHKSCARQLIKWPMFSLPDVIFS